MAAKLTRLTHKIAIQLRQVAAVPFAVLPRGGQSGNFWIHPRVCVCVAYTDANRVDTESELHLLVLRNL